MSVACKHEPHACTSALSGHDAVCARGGTRLGSYCRTDPQTQREWLSERCERASASGASRSDAACHPLPPLPPLPLPLGALPALFPPTARCAARMNEAHTRALAPSSLLGRRVGCRLEGSGHCAGSASREAPASERTPARRRPPAPLRALPTIQIGWEGARGVRAARRCAAQAAVALALARDRTHRAQPPKRSQTKKGRAGQRALACAHSSPPGA